MRVINEAQEKRMSQQEGQFGMDDVKEMVFAQTLAAYNEKKQILNYVSQLEERIKELEEVQKAAEDDGK